MRKLGRNQAFPVKMSTNDLASQEESLLTLE
jgi:hypothetical protein